MITVSYSGVHQAYQIALAAQELGLLDRFLCSVYDAPGKWGRHLSLLLGSDVLRNRRLEGIDPVRVLEFPWPELWFKVRARLSSLPTNAWIAPAQQFDRWAARAMDVGRIRGVICAENCAHDTFRRAEEAGLLRIYDCPGHNAVELSRTTEAAARITGLPGVSEADTPETSRRKEVEIALADFVLSYSDFHSSGIASRGVEKERIIQIPLWTDAGFWCPGDASPEHDGPLKVLFAGGLNLRKGVPFLIDAVRPLAPHATLTLVGHLDPDVKPCLAGTEDFAKVLAPVGKDALRDIYRQHDVLVLPTLGDSFGFVAMEAMACGLPVIVTTHCGAPMPDAGWRVPVLNSNPIRERLERYLDARELVAKDGLLARRHARDFTPERYRREIGSLLRSVLHECPAATDQ